MTRKTKAVLAISVFIAPLLIAARRGEEMPQAAQVSVALNSTAEPSDCFGCFQGGLGNPVICTEDDHFDKPNLSGNFMGTPHGDEDCIPTACEDDHIPFCEPGELIAAVAEAIRTDDVDALALLWERRSTLRLDPQNAAVRVFDCKGISQVAEFRLTRAQMARLMSP